MKNKSKLLVGAMLVVAPLTFGSTAWAGEVTGNGTDTPIADHHLPASICAFSGQNDTPTGNEDPIDNGRVQSFGDIVQEIVKTTGRGASPLTETIRNEGPGTACRG